MRQYFLKTWYSDIFFQRKFSCQCRFEATRLDIHATPNLFELQRVVQKKQDNFARCRISLKHDILRYFFKRKFSCGFSFEATHLNIHTTPNLFELQRVLQDIQANFARCVISLIKCFHYVRICLYSATLYFLITWYSYIFFREKTLLCLLF